MAITIEEVYLAMEGLRKENFRLNQENEELKKALVEKQDAPKPKDK